MEKLERALKVDLAWLRMATRLSERAAEWRRAQAADDRLLHGAALAEAEDWLSRIPSGATLNPETRAYLTSAEPSAALTSPLFSLTIPLRLALSPGA
jgi:hypothetical protein